MISKNIKPVLLFDVNETLLDMTPLKKTINTLLEEPLAFKIWFGMVLHHSLVDNCTNQYHDFSTIAAAMLKMTATSLNKTITQDETKKALLTMRDLRAYPDALLGLQLLKNHGFRLATLTNSPAKVLDEQLLNSKLTSLFDLVLSIDTIQKYKPDPITYEWAATKLGVKPQNIIMVAAHGWDLTGAMNAGLQTGFIARTGQSLYSLSDTPTYEAPDIYEMAQILIKEHK